MDRFTEEQFENTEKALEKVRKLPEKDRERAILKITGYTEGIAAAHQIEMYPEKKEA